MHLATLMHSRLCYLLYNHVICIVGVSRGVRFVKGGKILSRGRLPPFDPNEALHSLQTMHQLHKNCHCAGEPYDVDQPVVKQHCICVNCGLY